MFFLADNWAPGFTSPIMKRWPFEDNLSPDLIVPKKLLSSVDVWRALLENKRLLKFRLNSQFIFRYLALKIISLELEYIFSILIFKSLRISFIFFNS